VPGGIDPAAQHCVDIINMHRAQAGVAPIQYSAKLSMFSTAALVHQRLLPALPVTV